MNWDQIEGKWKQTKLTDDDLDVIDGKQEELAGKIQERYGITREEAQKQIDSWDFSGVSSDEGRVRDRRAS